MKHAFTCHCLRNFDVVEYSKWRFMKADLDSDLSLTLSADFAVLLFPWENIPTPLFLNKWPCRIYFVITCSFVGK